MSEMSYLLNCWVGAENWLVREFLKKFGLWNLAVRLRVELSWEIEFVKVLVPSRLALIINMDGEFPDVHALAWLIMDNERLIELIYA